MFWGLLGIGCKAAKLLRFSTENFSPAKKFHFLVIRLRPAGTSPVKRKKKNGGMPMKTATMKQTLVLGILATLTALVGCAPTDEGGTDNLGETVQAVQSSG